jgi:hypothetical protein
MTTSHSSRCWIALYMNKEDLLWVWSEWGASMVIYSMLQVRNRENHLLPLLLTDPAYIRLGLHPYDHWPQNMIRKHFIYVCRRSDMSLKWVGCFNHFPTHATSESEKPRESPTSTDTDTEAVRPSIYQAGIACLWPLAAIEGAKTHYICIK